MIKIFEFTDQTPLKPCNFSNQQPTNRLVANGLQQAISLQIRELPLITKSFKC